MSFALDQRLKNDTFIVDESEQCLLLLMNDSQYDWFIVVPKYDDASEWHHLPATLQTELHGFCVELGEKIKDQLNADKINIAALGNVVSQLHVHVIGRKHTDPAWPGPVWGAHPPVPYSESEKQTVINQLNWPKLPF